MERNKHFYNTRVYSLPEIYNTGTKTMPYCAFMRDYSVKWQVQDTCTNKKLKI